MPLLSATVALLAFAGPSASLRLSPAAPRMSAVDAPPQQAASPAPDAISSSAPLHVLIAGGGVGGLALANCLELSDAPVTYTVLERTSEFKKFGGPIQLASNAMQAPALLPPPRRCLSLLRRRSHCPAFLAAAALANARTAHTSLDGCVSPPPSPPPPAGPALNPAALTCAPRSPAGLPLDRRGAVQADRGARDVDRQPDQRHQGATSHLLPPHLLPPHLLPPHLLLPPAAAATAPAATAPAATF